MAAGNKVLVRLYESDSSITNYGALSRALSDHRMGLNKSLIFLIQYSGTLSATKTQIETPNSSPALSTAAQLVVVSSSADDDDKDTGAVRTIAILGILSSGVFSIEVVSMSGVTPVTTSGTFSHVIHAWALSWGSAGGDAAGNITITDGSTTILTIKAGANESDNTKLYFPANYLVHVNSIQASLTSQNNVANCGVFTMDFLGFLEGNDPDFDSIVRKVSHYNFNIDAPKRVFISGSGANITFSENYLGGAETYNLTIIIEATPI